ncbi:hypothetical protein [Streptomyces yaizuensis]|uniref:Uncharacterized protein n=1 Tax=Streptomyces yaizuensis TaxID=2989713 RepID=A0ABQ5P3H4_9ACTN|nr:hypothetical protein [Streptomyces sp. YSPA8]GLF97057.1 hypothetical protein SYYSPA8_22190 [Streptomyces sp. YSPA8]
MDAEDFRPTHVVPHGGLAAWEAPDVSLPTAPLDPLLPVRLLELRGDWGRILCANGWSAWVDGRLLVAVPQSPPAAGRPTARTADPRPLLARAAQALERYREAVDDLAEGRIDGETLRQRMHGVRVGAVVDGDAMWLYEAEHERWVYADGRTASTFAVSGPPVATDRTSGEGGTASGASGSEPGSGAGTGTGTAGTAGTAGGYGTGGGYGTSAAPVVPTAPGAQPTGGTGAPPPPAAGTAGVPPAAAAGGPPSVPPAGGAGGTAAAGPPVAGAPVVPDGPVAPATVPPGTPTGPPPTQGLTAPVAPDTRPADPAPAGPAPSGWTPAGTGPSEPSPPPPPPPDPGTAPTRTAEADWPQGALVVGHEPAEGPPRTGGPPPHRHQGGDGEDREEGEEGGASRPGERR